MKPFFTLGVLFAVTCLLAATGCSSSETATGPTAAAPDSAPPAPPTATPAEAVNHYLEAVRTGDAVTVNLLLTDLARQKTTEKNIAVAPPGSDTASFQIGEVRTLSAQNAAHVDSQWTDIDSDGVTQTLHVTWIVRHEPAGWRVAGMMGQFIEGQPTMVFNFEDPEEVIRQQAIAREEMARQRGGIRQAQAPSQDTQTQ